MKLQANFSLPLLLTLSLVILAFASVSQASDELKKDPMQSERCEQRCQRQQPYFEEHLCRQKCEEEERQRGGGRQDNVQVMDVIPDVVGDAQEEYERCQETCCGSGKEQWQCQRKCQDEYEAVTERERERGRGHDEHHHHGGGGRYPQPREHDYTHCLRECEDREEGFPRQRQCKLHCEQEFGHHRERHRRREGDRGRRKGYNNHHKTKQQHESDNPYYFDSQSFESRYSTQEGQMRVLQRFSEKSYLLLGMDKFRVGIYEANPKTFMLPHHWDADSVVFVMKGKAVVTFLKQENRKTFNLERGDVLMIPAGTTTYLINSHNDEKLEIAELLRPVNTPGRYQQFFGVGGEESKSFFTSFSTEILQAALNIPREQLQKLLEQQKEGAIIKASHEQVRALAHKMSRRQFGDSRGQINLLDERPQLSNEHGEFFEVTPNEYQQLGDLDISVAYLDIKQGSMMAPHYNSRTSYVVLVEEGSGYFEIACPHLASESNKKQRGGSQSYEKVRSRLSKGDVFVVPAGHPVAIVASENENLRAIGFGINALNNQRNFLAGQDNIVNQLDEEAMEMSFNLPAREVEEMFQKQRRSHFMAGPQRQRNALLSALDFAGF